MLVNHVPNQQREGVGRQRGSKWERRRALRQSWQASIILGFHWLCCWNRHRMDSLCHHSYEDLKQGFLFSPREVVYVLKLPWISARCVYVTVCVMSPIFILICCLAVVKVLSGSICWIRSLQMCLLSKSLSDLIGLLKRGLNSFQVKENWGLPAQHWSKHP